MKKYLTEERFEKFLGNDFYHLKSKVTMSLWLSGVILVAVVGKLIVDFFFGG